jgi:hypothetical protein
MCNCPVATFVCYKCGTSWEEPVDPEEAQQWGVFMGLPIATLCDACALEEDDDESED